MKSLSINKAIVIGNYKIIISKLNQFHVALQNETLDTSRIIEEEVHFSHIKYFHVIRTLNTTTDTLANEGV